MELGEIARAISCCSELARLLRKQRHINAGKIAVTIEDSEYEEIVCAADELQDFFYELSTADIEIRTIYR